MAGIMETVNSLIEEKKRENDLKNFGISVANKYGYIGTSVYLIIQDVTRNTEIQLVDVANEELLKLSTNANFIYVVPTYVELKAENVQAIKRRVKQTLSEIFSITSNEAFNRKFKVDLVNRQILIRMM